jgi:hypothetical protein
MSTETSLEQVLYNSDYWKGLSNPEKSSLAFPYGGSEEEKKKWLEENNILETPEISSDVDTVDDFDAAFEASLDPDAEEVVIEEGTDYGEGLGSRIGAKKIWTYFKDNGQVTQDFETWYKKLKENPAAQNKLYQFGKNQGFISQDFNSWKNKLTGYTGQEEINIFGENVDESSVNNTNAAKNWSSNSNNIVSQIEELKQNPILFTQEDVNNGLVKENQIGNVNVEATNNEIKNLTNQFPNILEFDNQKAAEYYRSQEIGKIDEKYKDLNEQKRRVEDGEYTRESDLQRQTKSDLVNIKDLEDIRANVRKGGITSWVSNKEVLKKIAENGGMKKPENFEAYWNDFNKEGEYYTKQRNTFLNNMIKNYETNLNEMGVYTGISMAPKKYIEAPIKSFEVGFIDRILDPTEMGGVPTAAGKLGRERSQVFYTPHARTQLEEKLENHFSGKEIMETGELAQIVKVNPEAVKYVKSLYPEINVDTNELETYTEVVNKATLNDPRFQAITEEIKNNLNKKVQDKYIELGQAYDTTSQKGLELAQEEFQNWYTTEFNTALANNPEAGKLFQSYGLATSEANTEMFADFARSQTPELAWIDAQLEDATSDSWGDQWTRGTMRILESVYKADTNVADVFNNIDIAVNDLSGTLQKRDNIVKEIQFALDNNLINKDTTLGEARRILNKGGNNLDQHLRMTDWIWSDDDTIGDYLERKEERLANSEERVLEDINEKIEYAEELSKYRQTEGGGFNTIEDVLNSIAGGIDQAPQFVPKAIGYTLYGAGLISGNPALIMGGKGAIAISGIMAGAQSYGSSFMEALENRMIEEYGENGYTSEEYLQALKDGLGTKSQAGALGSGITVGGVELLGDLAFAKLGGAFAKEIFGKPFMKQAVKNSFLKFIINNGARYATLKGSALKEGITEGFQSYLEQGFTNLASGYDSPFSSNISSEQIWTEAKAGYQMGHLFGLGGISGNVAGNYFSQANQIAKNIDMSPDSSTFLASDKYFDELVNGVKNNKKLTEDQKATEIQAISDIRNASIKIPKTITGDSKSTLIDLLVEKSGLDRKIKQVNDKDISAGDIDRRNQISEEIQGIVDNANVELALDKNVSNVRQIVHKSSKGKITIDEVADAKEANAFAKSERLQGWKTKYSSNQGTILQNPKTGEQKIIINRDQALKDQAVNVAGHEFLHGLLFETVKNSPETAINMGNALDSELKKLKVSEDSKYYKRLERYKNDPEAMTAEEKLTLFSDALASGDLKFNENLFTQIGDNIRRVLQAVGLKGIKFNNGRDVYNFLKDYNNSIEKGELNLAQEKLLAGKAEGDLIVDEVIDTDKKAKASKPGTKTTIPKSAPSKDIYKDFAERTWAENLQKSKDNINTQFGQGTVEAIKEFTPWETFKKRQIERGIDWDGQIAANDETRMQKDYEAVQRDINKRKKEFKAGEARARGKSSKSDEKVSKARQAELDKMTPNQRLALEGKGPLQVVQDADGNFVMEYGSIAETSDARKSPYRNVKGKSGIPTGKSSKSNPKALSELTKQYKDGNYDNVVELTQQYQAAGRDALKRWAGKRNVPLNLSNPQVNQEITSLLNKEFESFTRNFDPSKSEASTYMNQIAKRVGPTIVKEATRKGKQVSQDVLQEKGVAVETTTQKDFDSTKQKDTSRKKKYPSSIPAIKNQITENVAADLVGGIVDGKPVGLAKDIISSINRNTDPEKVAQNIIADTKDKGVMRTMRELVGKWGSPEYNAFVNTIIDQGLIGTIPASTIKRRLGRQSNVDSGLINYKKIGKTDQIKVKDGKKTYSRPDVYAITKLDKNKLKDYYKDNEKRQQSLFSMLTEGVMAEGVQTLRNDKNFMDKLQDVLELKNSPLTAEEFMDGLEQKLDQRTKEDRSLDEVTVKSAKKDVPFTDKEKKQLKDDSQAQIKELNEYDALPTKAGVKLTKDEKQIKQVQTIVAYHKLGPEFHTSPTIAGGTDTSMYQLIGDADRDLNGPLDAETAAILKEEGIPTVTRKGKVYYDKSKANSIDIKATDNKGNEIVHEKGGSMTTSRNKGKPISTIQQAQNEQMSPKRADGSGGSYKNWSMKELRKHITDPNWLKVQRNKIKVLKNIAKTIAADLNSVVKGSEAYKRKLTYWTAWLESQVNNSRHPIRALAPITFFSKVMFKDSRKLVAEHTLPANEVSSMILGMAKRNTVDRDFKFIEKNYEQGKITKLQDDMLKTNAEGINLSRHSPNIFFDEDTSVFVRYTDPSVNDKKGGMNMNTWLVWDNKGNIQTKTEQLGVGLTASQYNMPKGGPRAGRINQNLIQEQNNFIYDMLTKGEPTAKVAKERLTARYNLKVQRTKTNIVAKNSKSFGDQIFDEDGTSTAQKETMLNSLETRVLAAKPNRPAKGISIFDFDDTLAKTKEKVIVIDKDGKRTEISAAKFAKTADILVEGGASFDFSNFEKVAKGTKKGPLADIALKRQGKFGSGDIFVLTARPQSAAPAIKQFLDSIGLDIPIENITGLADGTAQAKVDFVLNKTAEGYNDFYFADDSIANVKGVQQVLDAVDVKSDTVIAKASKQDSLNKDFENQIEEVTGVESFKKYSTVRAKLEGKKKDAGFLKRVKRQFTITSSADDFLGLLYPIMGKGEQGNKHRKFIDDNLMNPYNKAEQELMSAQMSIARDFENLKKQFPGLKSTGLSNPLMDEIGVGPYTKSQAIRVYMWAKQGMEIPGMSKRDINDLVKAVESDNELNVFADEVMLITKGNGYPAPTNNWLAGNISQDIISELQSGLRPMLMTEFNENVEKIFTPDTMNKLEAIYGSKWREAFEDNLRRMKSGSNRPVYVGGGARIVNEMLDWLNKAVGNMMFLNIRSGTLQLLSNVNFINWGDNNIYNAAKAFASKDYWPTVMKLLNSDYLVNRRDGLKINVNEAELADAGKKGGFKGALSYLLDKGFVITRIMDSVAIATGGATFFINRKKALLNRTNPETNKKYTEAEAEVKAFDDFYAISEETQQSSNPSKISQQQASLFGRTILAFQNVTMQYNRKAKKMLLDLINRRKRPGMTQRESDLSNISGVLYYTTIQNLVFNSMQQALFALMFDDATDEEEKDKAANILNGMLDSILFGFGFGGAITSTVKNVGLKILSESERKSPDYEEAVWEVFNVSPVIDSKVRKLRSAAKTFNWNMDKVKSRGWSIENPAYLAVAQVLSAGFNVPIDRVLQKYNNMAQAMDEETRTWQRIALIMGYSGWNFDLPYWGTQSHLLAEQAEIEEMKQDYKYNAKKLKAQGYKRIPLTGPKAGKPDGKLNEDYIEVERWDGVIEYWINLNK